MRIRSNRLLFFIVSVFFCLGLIALSVTGVLTPLQGLLAVPLQAVQGAINSVVQRGSTLAEDLLEIQTLQQRNRDLERQLAAFQAEIVELREIAHDYDRLAALVNYTRSRTGEEYVVADVIARDISSFRRVIYLNRGARDGLTEGMPVVTERGLVGRIIGVSATASQVLLVLDTTSAVSARLQTSRAEGSVQGQLTDTLLMTFIDLNATVQEGDTVITSGMGGNFPAGIIIGQVTSVARSEFELFQEAEVRSLNNFERLEQVLVITNFQPVDLSAFE